MKINNQPLGRAVSYARTANADPAVIRVQHQKNVACAARDGYQILPEHCFSDDGACLTATSRPDFERMVNLLSRGDAGIERVYMRDPSRLGRWADPRLQIRAEAQLTGYGVQLCYSDRAPAPDPVTAGVDPSEIGPFLRAMVDNLLSSEERARLIRRTKGGRERRVLQGYYPSSGARYGTERWWVDLRTGEHVERIPEGYGLRRIGCAIKLRWCEGEPIRVLQDLYRWTSEERLTFAACTRRLIEQGARPPERAAGWSAALVAGLLTDPLYCGTLVWGRSTRAGDPRDVEERGVPGEAPLLIRDYLPGAPISRTEFEAVQRVLAARKRTRSH